MILRILLYPFSVLYDMATRLRNYAYDNGYRKVSAFSLPVVAVGNLSVGGSGKTPMIEYMIRLLVKDFGLAVVSRGYGRHTRGLRMVTHTESAATVGDEPYQLFQKFDTNIKVVVAEERVRGIEWLLRESPHSTVVLLDDAFQHRAVKPKLNILLTPFSNPFYHDHLLPAGRLRETRHSAQRADIIVVTKCDRMIDEEAMLKEVRNVQRYAGIKPVFFSYINYGSPVPFKAIPSAWSRSVVLVSGIAQPESFESYARQNFQVLRHFQFPDHHDFQLHEVASIVAYAKAQTGPVAILTTEKDMVRLTDGKFDNEMNGSAWFYLPIETVFVKNGAEFDKRVLASCSK